MQVLGDDCAFTHLFSRAILEGNYFSCGAHPSRPLPTTQPLQARIPLLKRVELRSQKERSRGRISPEEGWGGQGEKREKGCAKKGLEKNCWRRILFMRLLPSHRKVIHIVLSQNTLCKRLFIHIRELLAPPNIQYVCASVRILICTGWS